MSELTEFLLARIAEDEEVARAATAGPWRWDEEPTDEWGHQPPDLVTVAEEEQSYTALDGTVRTYVTPVATVVGSWGHDADGVSVSDEDAAHIARWDPARVLVECDAKRRIVAQHKTIAAGFPGTTIETSPCCATCSAGGEYPGRFPCQTLRLLALPYADHPDYLPDYLPEWRP